MTTNPHIEAELDDLVQLIKQPCKDTLKERGFVSHGNKPMYTQEEVEQQCNQARYSAEVWLPYITNTFNGEYEISSAGRVRRNGKVLAQSNISNNDNSYKVVSLSNNNERKNYYVHRLVAHCFLPNLDDKRTVNHRDGIRSNNTLSNLEWATYAENERHAYNVLGKQAHNKGKRVKECAKGHPMSGENLLISPLGRNICRACVKEWRRLRNLKNSQAKETEGTHV